MTVAITRTGEESYHITFADLSGKLYQMQAKSSANQSEVVKTARRLIASLDGHPKLVTTDQCDIQFFGEFRAVRHELAHNDATIAPPQLGERALYLILSKQDRENLIGDLAEEYAEVQSKHGTRFAAIWYWKQVGASVFPLTIKAIRWFLYAGIVEWFRRHI
jgi:hypothetical protein